MNRSSQQCLPDILTKRDTHCEYFQTLENKLLKESDKLTKFMDRLPVSPASKRQLRLPSSTGTIPLAAKEPSTPTFSRMSTKTENQRIEPASVKRAKELCEKMKRPLAQQAKNESERGRKDRYEQLRKAIYTGEGFNVEQRVEEERVERVERKRNMRTMSETQSLKDTISTESGRSLRLMTEQMLPMLNQDRPKLEDFEVIKLLGEGRFGQVSLVRHRKTNFLCALKGIPNSLMASDPKQLIQRIRQIKIQTFLDHPNIVQLYSVFVEESNLYLLMELCCEGNLYQRLRLEGSFAQEKIRGVVRQICYAVEYMHDNDILHRDIKPQNIIFHQNIVKICDFGWSVYSPLLRNTLCGTPLYSSPEVVQKQHYDNKVDVWNIGILTYELLYGRVPFEIRSEEEVVKVVEEEIYFPRNLPASPEIKNFILKCLCKNARDRWTLNKLLDHQFLSSKGQAQR